MTDRPDIAATLEPGEHLLWRGHPKKGRPISARANLIGTLFYAVTMLLLVFGWWLEIYWGHVPAWHLAVYGVVGTAAFCTYVGLKITLLDRRRARARDARTAYGITNRRVVVRAGPYTADLPLGPEVQAVVKSGGLNITAPGTTLRLDRLDNAKAARDVLLAQIGGET